jgi:hypothetical protein
MINHHFLAFSAVLNASIRLQRVYISVQLTIIFRFVQLYEYDFKMSTVNEKVKAGFAKLGEYFYARDLILILAAFVVESLLIIGIQEYGKTLKDTTVRITCNDKSINYPMAPEEQIDWTKQLFVAGILFYFVISIGDTISVMKKLDYESQTGMLDGTLRNVPMIRLVRCWGSLGLNADWTIFLRAGYFRT